MEVKNREADEEVQLTMTRNPLISPPSAPISDIGDIPSSTSVSKSSTKSSSTAKRATAAIVFLNARTPVGASAAKSHSSAETLGTSKDLHLEKTADSMGPASAASGSFAAALGDSMGKMDPVSVEHGDSVTDVGGHKSGSRVPSNDKARDVSGGDTAVSSNLPDATEAEMVKVLDLKMQGAGRSLSIGVDKSDELEGQGDSKKRTKDHNVIVTDGSNISEWHGGEWPGEEWPGGEWPNGASPLHRDHQIYLYFQGLDDMPSYDDSFKDEIEQVNAENHHPSTSPDPQVAKDKVIDEFSITEGNSYYPDCNIPVAVRGQSDDKIEERKAGDNFNAGSADTDETIMVLKDRAASGISVDSFVEQLGSHDNCVSTRNCDGSTDLQAVVKQGRNSEELEAETARYKAAVDNVNSLRSQIVSPCSGFAYSDTEA
ncbi:hypothetical protein RUND412_005040 [Rhizina undulata]